MLDGERYYKTKLKKILCIYFIAVFTVDKQM